MQMTQLYAHKNIFMYLTTIVAMMVMTMHNISLMYFFLLAELVQHNESYKVVVNENLGKW